MANPYYKTFQFNDKVNGKGDSIKLSFKFTVSREGSDIIYVCEDEGIFINDLGVLEYEWSPEDFLLVPGILEMQLVDTGKTELVNPERKLHNIFFGDDETSIATDEEGEATIQIKYNGDDNYTEEFSGKISKAPNSNPGSKYISLIIAPPTDILNRAVLYDTLRSDLVVNKNPLGYVHYTIALAVWKPIKEIIEKSFQYVSPGNSLDFIHNWELSGTETQPQYSQLVLQGFQVLSNPSVITNIKLEEIRYNINELFFDKNGAAADYSLGDLLRKFAFDWGAIAGMITKNKFFFRQLFTNNTYITVQDEDGMLRDSYDLEEYNIISMAQIRTKMGYDLSQARPDVVGRSGSDFNRMKYQVIDEYTLPELWSNDESGLIVVLSLLAYRESNDTYYFVNISGEDPINPGHTIVKSDHPILLADQLFNLRGSHKTLKVKYFKLEGIKYNFLDDIFYNGIYYTPISMKKHIRLKDTFTEFKCLKKSD